MPKANSPSNLSIKLIAWLCKDELVEELQGDLLQYHIELKNKRFKSLRYWFQVINYLRPSTIRSFKTQNSGPMFIFNPILTLRNLYRHKSTSIISIFGFTMGLVATFFLYFYIYSEVSTDQFHEDKDQTYRLLRVGQINGSPYRIGVTSVPYAQALLTDFPSDVKSVTRVAPERGLVEVGEKKFYENQMIFTDQNFFEFFSYPLISGDKKTVLSTANSAVISKAAAEKYFGDEDPIGKLVKLDNEFEFIITGVMDEMPANSHLNFNMVFPITIMEGFDWFGGWWSNGLITYLKIPTEEQAANVEGRFEWFMDKYFGEDFEQSGNKIGLELEALGDIYFNNDTRYDFGATHGNFSSIITLGAVAIAILFIACFNYVNLSIAQSFSRAKEVGVRKVLGGSKFRLVFQFLSESLMILLFSILFSIGVCELIRPFFNNFFGLQVELNWFDQNVLLFFLLLVFGVMLSSGVYPALLLSSFKSVSILRGSKLYSGKNVGLRKILVVTQFAISIFLIVASILISIQTDFLNSKELGFDKEAVVLVDLDNSEIRNLENREKFKDRLMANSNVLGVSSFSGEPGGFHDASTFQITGIDENHRMRTLFTDTEYFNLMDIEIVEGRPYSKEIVTDEQFAVILNEKAVQELGIDPAEVLGRKVTMPGWDIDNVPIIGVVADYHFISLQHEIEPLAILCGGFHRKLGVKINMTNARDQLSFVEETYDEIAPNFPMNYQFLDDKLGELYEKEQQQTRIFSTFSGLSIFLACLGIFGLAAYATSQRQKELGIRKVLGATARQIIGLISKEFVLLVLIASIIAIPVSGYFINNWLTGYAYRIEMIDHWYVFIVGGLAAALIALVTVTFKTYRAAISDPTESIRNE
ncbi:MAG: ABC transporter permease [Bacteroidota bacterium]